MIFVIHVTNTVILHPLTAFPSLIMFLYRIYIYIHYLSVYSNMNKFDAWLTVIRLILLLLLSAAKRCINERNSGCPWIGSYSIQFGQMVLMRVCPFVCSIISVFCLLYPVYCLLYLVFCLLYLDFCLLYLEFCLLYLEFCLL